MNIAEFKLSHDRKMIQLIYNTALKCDPSESERNYLMARLHSDDSRRLVIKKIISEVMGQKTDLSRERFELPDIMDFYLKIKEFIRASKIK